MNDDDNVPDHDHDTDKIRTAKDLRGPRDVEDSWKPASTSHANMRDSMAAVMRDHTSEGLFFSACLHYKRKGTADCLCNSCMTDRNLMTNHRHVGGIVRSTTQAVNRMKIAVMAVDALDDPLEKASSILPVRGSSPGDRCSSGGGCSTGK